MTDRMWIALAAVVFLIAAAGFCVWWWLVPGAEIAPGYVPPPSAYADDDTADELHQIALDLPGGVAPAPAAGEHHCAVCGQVHDDDTRLDPGWFGRWEVEQAEWMAGFHRDQADDVATALSKIADELRKLREQQSCHSCCGHVHHHYTWPITTTITPNQWTWTSGVGGNSTYQIST